MSSLPSPARRPVVDGHSAAGAHGRVVGVVGWAAGVSARDVDGVGSGEAVPFPCALDAAYFFVVDLEIGAVWVVSGVVLYERGWGLDLGCTVPSMV